ncbi:oxidative damage protection protein [Gilvimarinus agarilyticus]|uniref:oxidative damage protection protein n=1 Tax=Gilvimarinus agarilyticus TaxID=679259 RepID=UPI0005A0C117|nr:oxidative damage protection protein [Gilvimarinus agarilyticus]|tara:strand:- start:104 stop:382 length:279 start_codon:yes stop_codon:yes gene_type:complete
MSRTVMCRKYKQELPGLAQPPFPGPKGQDVYDNVSQKAWQEWMSHQTMLINEKQLNLMDTGTRVYLGEQMTKFLSGEDYDAAEGYVPPTEDK